MIHKLTFEQIVRSLKLLFATAEPGRDKHPVPGAILGGTGSAKTALMKFFYEELRRLYEERGIDFQYWQFPTSTTMLGDVRLPDGEAGRIIESSGLRTFGERWAEFLPLEKDAFGMLDVDEFDRVTSKGVLNQFQRVVLDRDLGVDVHGIHKRLSPKVFTVLTGNGTSDRNTQMPHEAMLTRMCFLYIDPYCQESREQHMAYAIDQGWDPAVRAAMALDPDTGEGAHEFAEWAKRQRRTEELAERIMRASRRVKFRTDDILPACLAGVVGSAWASKIIACNAAGNKVPDIAAIFAHPDKANLPDETMQTWMVLDALIHNADTPAKQKAIIVYGERIRVATDQTFIVAGKLNELARLHPELTSTPEFVAWVKANGAVCFA